MGAIPDITTPKLPSPDLTAGELRVSDTRTRMLLIYRTRCSVSERVSSARYRTTYTSHDQDQLPPPPLPDTKPPSPDTKPPTPPPPPTTESAAKGALRTAASHLDTAATLFTHRCRLKTYAPPPVPPTPLRLRPPPPPPPATPTVPPNRCRRCHRRQDDRQRCRRPQVKALSRRRPRHCRRCLRHCRRCVHGRRRRCLTRAAHPGAYEFYD